MKIEIKKETERLGCRTIDPSDGWSLKDGVLTVYDFIPYKSCKHNIKAGVTILENSGDKILLRVESIDWVTNQNFPYSTQGCYLFQASVEKYGKIQTSADRVPCSCDTIEDAISYLTPAEVKKAENSGRKVLRQGDFFFIEMKNKTNLKALDGSNHKVSEIKGGYSVKHPQHKALNLHVGHWKAIQRKTMNQYKAD